MEAAYGYGESLLYPSILYDQFQTALALDLLGLHQHFDAVAMTGIAVVSASWEAIQLVHVQRMNSEQVTLAFAVAGDHLTVSVFDS